MKNIIQIIVSVSFLLLIAAGCTGVRYSPIEIKGFSPEVQDYIKAGTIDLDMTQLQVRYAWGAPMSVNVLTPATDGKLKEEWIYRTLCIFKSRLIFTDGLLTEIISSEPSVKKDRLAPKKKGSSTP